jgi:hypothetical protein
MNSCGPANKKLSSLSVSLSGLAAGNLYDSGYLRLISESQTKDFRLTDSNTIEIPKGTWDFYFVGFTSTAPYLECGSVPGVVLNQDAHTVNISVSTTCGGATYPAIVDAAAGKWDIHFFDNSTWGY